MAIRVGVLLAAALMLPSASPAAAAPPRAAGGPDRALDLFEQSARAYREGRFQDAVDRLLEARKLKPEPVLLYNLARAYEALGRLEEAADAYAQYLGEEPAAVDRRAIEARVATLRAQAAELAAARRAESKPAPDPPAPAPVAPPPDLAPVAPPDRLAFLPWVVAGVGVAALGTGFALGAVARGTHDDAVAEPRQRAAAEKQASAEGLASAATITILAGAIVAAAGVVWILVRPAGATPARRALAGAPGWSF